MIGTGVFSNAGMQHCEDRGRHTFGWVSTSQTWTDRGFEECHYCGVTRFHGTRGSDRWLRFLDTVIAPIDEPEQAQIIPQTIPAASAGDVARASRAHRLGERNARIVEARRRNETLRTIADRESLSEQMVSRVCIDAGLGRK